ncbi:MAG: hypothetical protein CMC15_13835 [Flavobacteriaceae bacterium]|nr:hypothetical protein [Flavobacteriaceae bacterium]|tara:strand:+ start:258 stop:596 length:339 start_codon:yes stop_codon:yes gene_type:complete
MLQTVSEDEFISAFDDYNRSENFTVSARRAMFEYFEELEEAFGEPLLLDVIGICCEYSEYADEDEVKEAYGLEEDDEIEDYTDVIPAYTFDTSGPNALEWKHVQSSIVIRDW